MINSVKKLLKVNRRYKDFELLDVPAKFNNIFAGNNIQVVQLHSIEPCGDNDIVGFCGAFSWKDNKISPLDGDSYSDSMLVYGYEWFEDESGARCLDILVKDW